MMDDDKCEVEVGEGGEKRDDDDVKSERNLNQIHVGDCLALFNTLSSSETLQG